MLDVIVSAFACGSMNACICACLYKPLGKGGGGMQRLIFAIL